MVPFLRPALDESKTAEERWMVKSLITGLLRPRGRRTSKTGPHSGLFVAHSAALVSGVSSQRLAREIGSETNPMDSERRTLFGQGLI